MSSNPMSYIPTAMTAADSSGLDSIIPMLQMAKGGWDMLDAAKRGRMSQGIGAALNMYGGYQGMQKLGSKTTPTNTIDGPTTKSKFGMSRDEFMQLDPQLRERMLQQLMGR